MTKPASISPAQRAIVKERAHNRCEYCQSRADFATASFHADHIHPQSQGGTTTLDNLAFSCVGCNLYKAARTHALDPKNKQMAPLFNPRQQSWNEHFCWDENATLIRGTTSTGRATVEALRLNRPNLVNLRRILYPAQQHPPKDTSFCQEERPNAD